MNCGKAEREIYLYRELTSRERELLDRHLSGCPACRAIMERISKQQVTLQRIRDMRPPTPDHDRITRTIMSEISERKQSGRKQIILPFHFKLAVQPLRYAMATLSVILLATFALEYNSGAGSSLVVKSFPGNTRTHVALNSASFYKSFLIEKKQASSRTPSIYECLTGCVKGTQEECPECDKFSNF